MPIVYWVVPWYPDKPTGGAEFQARHTIQALRQRGVDARVLTTCVPSFRDDHGINALPAGPAIVDGVPVERLPVDGRDWRLFDQVNLRILRGEPLTDAEAEVFAEEGIRSRALEARLSTLPSAAIVVYMPYLFGTTYWGMAVRPGWLLPCLHDEAYARLAPTRRTVDRALGLLCNSTGERELALRLYGITARRAVAVGEGVPMEHPPGDDARFRARTGVGQRFLLCVARKDHGKNVEGVLAGFAAFAARRPEPRLVLVGAGSLPVPPGLRDRVVDLGFVDEELKRDAFAACLAHCVPGVNESFSLVLMEGWLAGRPALVNAGSEVTRDHARLSSGGLAYDGPEELAAALAWLSDHPAQADRMGANGGEYVRRNFTWDTVVARLRRALGL